MTERAEAAATNKQQRCELRAEKYVRWLVALNRARQRRKHFRCCEDGLRMHDWCMNLHINRCE